MIKIMPAKKKTKKPTKSTTSDKASHTLSTADLENTEFSGTSPIMTMNSGTSATILDVKTTPTKKIVAGKIDGEFWVWPNGLRTHINHIAQSIRKGYPLPRGFYAEAARVNRPNLNLITAKAKSQALKDDRDINA